MLMAVSADKVVHVRIFDGSCNSMEFADFIRTLPEDCPKNILMDNVSFHKSLCVRDEIHRRHMTAIYVPPYSPKYNPIEYVFAYIKQRMRRFVDAHGPLPCNHHEVIERFACTPENVLRNSFTHVWNDIKECVSS